jgi:hypothetical protein
MTPATETRCYVCTGKDCRRDEGHRELLDAMRAVGNVERVRCQDLCEGPVAGVLLGDRVEWFEKLRKPRHRAAVAALVQHPRTKVPSELKDRWAKKHGGKIKR